jgi:hypothetical protein
MAINSYGDLLLRMVQNRFSYGGTSDANFNKALNTSLKFGIKFDKLDSDFTKIWNKTDDLVHKLAVENTTLKNYPGYLKFPKSTLDEYFDKYASDAVRKEISKVLNLKQ